MYTIYLCILYFYIYRYILGLLPVIIFLAIYLLLIINREGNTYQAIITYLISIIIISFNIIINSILHSRSGSLGGKHQRPQ